MTYRQFLAALRKTRTTMTWHVHRDGDIESTSRNHCPVTAVWNAREFLSARLERKIMDAADAREDFSPRIRRDLLRALGLKERT